MRQVLALSAAALALALAAPAAAQDDRPAFGTRVQPGDAANSAERPIRFAISAPAGGVLAIPVSGPDGLSLVPAPLREAVRAAVAAAGFEGSAGETLDLWAAGGYQRVMLVGTGAGPVDALGLADFGARVAQATRNSEAGITILARGIPTEVAQPGAHVARGAGMGQWRFDRLQVAERAALPVDPITIVADSGAGEAFEREHEGLVDAMRLVRDLIALPSNLKYPESFVAAASAAFEGVPGVTITVIEEAEMQRLGMGALLSVAQGSTRPARLMIVEYRGAGDAAPLALAGKGITFDSGGISLKDAAGMEAMRGDMAGAAAAVGAVLAAARRGARANVVAAAALAENMPDANASRPGDVVRTMNGQTIEIINTDAEGRLVLADANQYLIDRYRPAALVNIATLTGSMTTALGDDYAGLFARDEALAERLESASRASGDPLWRLPLHPSYAEDLASPIADIANVTRASGAGGGRGAHFIGYLTPEPTPWAHVDMASVDARRTTYGAPGTPPGFGVRLFDELIRSFER